MKVSVVLTSYNYGRFIGQAIESVLNQTHKDFELIITDDGSNDNSWDVICSYDDPRIRRFTRDYSIGCEENTNFGFNQATYDIVASICADDYWQPDKLEKQLKYIDSYDLIFTNVKIDGNINIFSKAPIKSNEEFLLNIYKSGNFVCYSSMMVKRKLSYKIQFDKNFPDLSDLKFFIDALKNGYKVTKLDEDLVNYRWHGSNISADKSLEKGLRVLSQYFNIFSDYINFDNFHSIFMIDKPIPPHLRREFLFFNPPLSGEVSEWFKKCI